MTSFANSCNMGSTIRGHWKLCASLWRETGASGWSSMGNDDRAESAF